MISSKDVARLAGVSQATVSRVARGSDAVSEATRTRVLNVIEQTGYRPAHKALSDHAWRPLHALLPGADDTDPRLLSALLRQAAAHRCLLTVSEHEAAPDHVAAYPAASAGPGEAGAGGHAGTFVVKSTMAGPHENHAATVFLCAGHAPENADAVGFDDAGSAQAVASYFARAGRQRVALVGELKRDGVLTAQARGFRQGVQTHDLGLARAHIIDCGDSYEASFNAVHEMLFRQGALPHAIYCTSDRCAVGVIEAARRLGLQVPQDIWVTGYGNTDIAAFTPYRLTTIKPAFEQLAQVAFATLLDRIADHTLPARRVDVDNEILVGHSTGCLPLARE